MKILNVNFSIDPKEGGGTAERTFQMSRFLAINNVWCTVLTLDNGLSKNRMTDLYPAKLVVLPVLWARYFVPLFNWQEIKKLVREADLVHLMGHWSLLNAIVYVAIRSEKKPYVVCPAGALPIFGRSAILKKIYNLIVGKKIIRNASGWIAVTTLECSQFLDYGVDTSKITVIPNGVNETLIAEGHVQEIRKKNNLGDAPIILFMGRLNYIKGPDLLIKAFIEVHKKLPDHHLVFAGPDEGMQKELIGIAKDNNLINNVHFLGFVNNKDKPAVYKMAKLLVVSSRQEAMSIVALEAGISGIPALVTDQCGFSEIKFIHEGLEVPASVEGLTSGLTGLLADLSESNNLGLAFHAYVRNRFSWDSLILKYLGLYKKIISHHVLSITS
jgi:glycosyltransferase involved in cell wall biosynthesis